MKKTIISTLLASTVIATGFSAQAKEFYTMNDDGELVRPTGYRTWVYVGTPLTPKDMNGGHVTFPEFHAVYIDPVSYDHYKETGEFRDGAILIKELSAVGSKVASSGQGYFMGEFIGLEATIKSSKYFPDEPGNWAYFSFTDHEAGVLADSAAPFPAAACNACHDATGGDDFVFTQYYPVLPAAKGVGKDVNPEDMAQRTKFVD